jgi:hypothetical protein
MLGGAGGFGIAYSCSRSRICLDKFFTLSFNERLLVTSALSRDGLTSFCGPRRSSTRNPCRIGHNCHKQADFLNSRFSSFFLPQPTRKRTYLSISLFEHDKRHMHARHSFEGSGSIGQHSLRLMTNEGLRRRQQMHPGDARCVARHDEKAYKVGFYKVCRSIIDQTICFSRSPAVSSRQDTTNNFRLTGKFVPARQQKPEVSTRLEMYEVL